jgi:hypothetical protein
LGINPSNNFIRCVKCAYSLKIIIFNEKCCRYGKKYDK